ncbi:MAG: hypothetical protein ABI068_08835 [Ktedonobacterales bacterium]
MATRGKSKDAGRAATPDTAADTQLVQPETVNTRAPETRPLPAIGADNTQTALNADAADDSLQQATESTPPISAAAAIGTEEDSYTNPAPTFGNEAQDDGEDDGEDDGDATMIRQVAPASDSPSRPRWNTLASAVSRPVGPAERSSGSGPGDSTPVSDTTPPQQLAPHAPRAPHAPVEPTYPPVAAGIADEIDEWSVADQPTVQMTPQMLQSPRPSYLDTGEQAQPVWPPRPAPQNAAPDAPPTPTPPRPQAPARPQAALPPSTGRPPLTSSPLAGGPRLASPQGRPMPPTPPAGIPKAALPNPRMERFQELRRHRAAHDAGEFDSGVSPSVADTVRQWWGDLRPGMQSALRYQHEARASGTHPIPAYEPTPTSRLGDVFGRLAASARGLTGRAQNAAGPTFKRIHDQMEHAAQGIVDRFEGNPVRQQAPFLGPGRVAIFFRQGVTVGQAQRLLAASNAQPMRLIPRKHGFLARVRPGHEADVCERLRQHPYVRDVVYLEYNEYGEPIEP